MENTNKKNYKNFFGSPTTGGPTGNTAQTSSMRPPVTATPPPPTKPKLSLADGLNLADGFLDLGAKFVGSTISLVDTQKTNDLKFRSPVLPLTQVNPNPMNPGPQGNTSQIPSANPFVAENPPRPNPPIWQQPPPQQPMQMPMQMPNWTNQGNTNVGGFQFPAPVAPVAPQPAPKNNTLLYVGLGIGGFLLLAMMMFVALKK